MKRTLRLLGLSALAMCLLTVFALADSGPKDLLTVKVENAPEEGYYLDLVAEAASTGATRMRKRQRWTRIFWMLSAPPCRRGTTPARRRAPMAPPCGESWREPPPAAKESISTPSAISAYRTPIRS